MKNHLQTYTLKLKTLSPVFIGSGKELTKKEYVYIPRGQQVLILNIPQFTRFLIKRNLVDKYSEFMLSRHNDLYRWLQEQKIKDDEIRKINAYQVNAADALRQGQALRGIQLFVKDNYGNPYIPGSSIKGALRTAILAKKVSENRSLHTSNINNFNDSMKSQRFLRKDTLKRETEKLETDALHTLNLYDGKSNPINPNNMVNSVMKGVQISDSEATSPTDLILTNKVDLTPAGNEKALPIFRESLRPGITINFKLTIDQQILATANITIDYIKTALREFAEIQEECFFSSFKLPANSDKAQSNGIELYLGGGVGYVSKTISYPMAGKGAVNFVANLMEKQFPQHKHDKDIALGVSPHILKGTYYNNKFYKMGRCAVEIL